jgi:ectoine hydroxylase-related dioxygenase (phytanoyl-CoA dioxygenase family)
VILEDQNAARGWTFVVPGSHLSDNYADQSTMADAVPIETKVGDIVIRDSRLWHGALGNATGSSRWSPIAKFVRW